MPKASEVAIELRKLADSLDAQPDQELFRPEVDFSCKYKSSAGPNVAKERFIALAHILPRPLKKGHQTFDENALELRYASDALIVVTSIEQSRVCTLIEPERVIPAKYDCVPLLSDDENAGIEAA